MMVEVHNGMSEGGGHVWDVHAADEIAHKKFHEPVTFVFRGRRGDSLWCDTGGGVGGGWSAGLSIPLWWSCRVVTMVVLGARCQGDRKKGRR